MRIGVYFDPSDAADARQASEFISQFADGGSVRNGLRQSVDEILQLGCGRLLRWAWEHFQTDRFTLISLHERTGEETSSLHSLTANLGRACAQRGVEVLDRHGGQPMELSIRQEVAEVLQSINQPNH